MQVGMAFGKFVLLHSGHVRFLEKARSLVDKLIVVVASDETVEKERGKVFVPAEQRREVIAALKSVDEAVVGDKADKYKIIAEKKPDVLILGPDQDHDEGKLAYDLECLGLKPKIVRIDELSEGDLHKTSKIIEKITSSTE
ncbi:adenylyltransferase/cytidyltransferase family protein [archaeon]